MRWLVPRSGASPQSRTTSFAPRPSTRSPAASSSRASAARRRSSIARWTTARGFASSTAAAPEIPSEVAATRLVRALGFAADTITLVEAPALPRLPGSSRSSTMKTVGAVHARRLYSKVDRYDAITETSSGWRSSASHDGQPIETDEPKGWAFSRARSGRTRRRAAPRARTSTRCACSRCSWRTGTTRPRTSGSCACQPTSGPTAALPGAVADAAGPRRGVRSAQGRSRRVGARPAIWADRATLPSRCGLPYDGATFTARPDRRSRPPAPRRAARQLTDAQVADLFAARALRSAERGLFSDVRPVDDWVRAFKTRVAMITDGPPCPAL